MIITLCFDYYDEKSEMIVKRILLFQGNRETHAVDHSTNRDMADKTICSTTTLQYLTGVSSALCATVNSL